MEKYLRPLLIKSFFGVASENCCQPRCLAKKERIVVLPLPFAPVRMVARGWKVMSISANCCQSFNVILSKSTIMSPSVISAREASMARLDDNWLVSSR